MITVASALVDVAVGATVAVGTGVAVGVAVGIGVEIAVGKEVGADVAIGLAVDSIGVLVGEALPAVAVSVGA